MSYLNEREIVNLTKLELVALLHDETGESQSKLRRKTKLELQQDAVWMKNHPQ